MNTPAFSAPAALPSARPRPVRRQLVLEFDNGAGALNRYTVHDPTVGQLITIETTKLAIAGGAEAYRNLSASQMVGPYALLDIIDAIAHFSVMVPQIARDLPAGLSYLDLTLEDIRTLVGPFKFQYWPWFTEVQQLLVTPIEVPKPLVAPAPADGVGTPSSATGLDLDDEE